VFKTFDMFLAMGLAWAFYGIFNIILRENRKDRDTPYALVVIICFTLQIFDHLLKPVPVWKDIIDPIFYFTRNIYFLTGPVLLLYTKSLIHKWQMKWQLVLIHAFPYLLWVVLSFVFPDRVLWHSMVFLNPAETVAGDGAVFEPQNILAIARVMGTFLSPILYGIYILIDINKHRKEVPQFYSNKNISNTLSWLSFLVGSLIGLCFIFLLMETYSLLFDRPQTRNPITVLAVYPVLFIFFFSYFSKEQKMPDDFKFDSSASKYEKSVLSLAETEKIYSDLLQLMEKETPFLDPNLTLDKVAIKIKTNKHNLSQVINARTNQNFYSFINNYRVQEFKRSLEQNSHPNITLIAVAFECGFSSSSAFYSTFRKITGSTPRDYIKSLSALTHP
jgi:AraC-like DNA-binding protein